MDTRVSALYRSRLFAHRNTAFIALTCLFALLANAQSNPQSSDLIRAAERGDLSGVTSLLKSGIDVNSVGVTQKTSSRSTALIEASRHGHLDIVQALLAAKADVNQRQDDTAALSVASQTGDLKIVQALLAAGADPNLDAGIPPLTQATLSNHVEVVQALLAAKAKVDAKGRGSMGSALYFAALHSRLAVLRALLAAGADVNAIQTTDGKTAVMVAAASAEPDGVRALIEAGANVNAMTHAGVTPLMLAAGRNDSGLAEVLLAAHADANGGFRVCDTALAAQNPSSNPGAKGLNATWLFSTLAGGSPLGAAAAGGNISMVRALLAAHADFNRVQCDGKTALALAVDNSHPEVATLLKTAGATK